MAQAVLAGLVGRTEDWLSKIENGRAPLDRLSVIRALADALGVTVLDLIGEPSPSHTIGEPAGLPEIRAALMDYRHLSTLLGAFNIESSPPGLAHLSRDVAEIMDAYQQSRYAEVLRRLPGLLTTSQVLARQCDDHDRPSAARNAALACQAAAMIVTKLGQPDLAWIAAQRGLTAAEQSGDPAVVGSLMRSVIHALHTHGRAPDAVKMTGTAAAFLLSELDEDRPETLAIYGTLLLPGAVAAARAGDRHTAAEYLNEAESMARRLNRDTNLLWTAFGPTNVKIHRVTVAMALGDVQIALDLIPTIDTSGLPVERRARHSLEIANAYSARNKVEEAIGELLLAERRAPEQIHGHIMSHQLVLALRGTGHGKRSRALADLARRMKTI